MTRAFDLDRFDENPGSQVVLVCKNCQVRSVADGWYYPRRCEVDLQLAMAFSRIMVAETYTAPDGGVAAGEVEVEPWDEMVNSGVTVPATPIVVQLNAAGQLLVALVATDDAGTVPAGATYRVTERVTGAEEKGRRIRVPRLSALSDWALTDASMQAGSAVLGSQAAKFSPVDVGRAVVVPGAGSGGAALVSTIASWSSPTAVILAAPAVGAVQGPATITGRVALLSSLPVV